MCNSVSSIKYNLFLMVGFVKFIRNERQNIIQWNNGKIKRSSFRNASNTNKLINM